MPLPGLRCNWNFPELEIRHSHWSSPRLTPKTPTAAIMTPKPPQSSDGSSLPPRHRPALGDLAKDTTESDLWAFDGLDLEPEEKSVEVTKSRDFGIPSPRDAEKRKTSFSGGPARQQNPPEIKINIRQNRPGNQPVAPSVGSRIAGDDFADLDHGDIPETPALVENYFAKTLRPVTSPVFPTAVPIAIIAQTTPHNEEADEFSPVVRENAVPISLRPHLHLSKVERIGLVTLLGLLVMSGIVISLFTFGRLPTESRRLKANDFPVNGKLVTIVSADSYWRAPVTEGKNAETFRRGTQLLPVLDITPQGGPAAIRVFFRNSDRELVGDAVNRAVQSGTTLHIAATAGFEDVGMHAAYRTGQSKPWTIEVYEAPSENSPGQDFKKLFEMNISTNRR